MSRKKLQLNKNVRQYLSKSKTVFRLALHQRGKMESRHPGPQTDGSEEKRNDEASRQKRQALSHQIPGGREFRSGVASATELIFMSESELSCSHLLLPCISWENSVTLSQLPDVNHSLRISHVFVVVDVEGDGDDGYIRLSFPVFPLCTQNWFYPTLPRGKCDLLTPERTQSRPPPPVK